MWLFFLVSSLKVGSSFWAALCGGGSVSGHVVGSESVGGPCSVLGHQQETSLLLGVFMPFYPCVEGTHPHLLLLEAMATGDGIFLGFKSVHGFRGGVWFEFEVEGGKMSAFNMLPSPACLKMF